MIRIGLLSVLLVPAALLSACVGSRGTVIVGMPQVNTRERLISERLERADWLRRELEASETIEPTLQGFRDVRSFAGIYSSLRASIDPAAGKLDALNADNEALRLEAQSWELRKQVEQARQSYDATVDGSTAADNGVTLTEPQGFRSIAAPPEADAPFDPDRELISPEQAVTSRAVVHPLDRFRDRLALRNAVEAELRETQFDDSHDILGSELYGLTLDLTVVPGKWSEEFVEVEVEFGAPRGDDLALRVDRLEQLYFLWLDELPELIERDVQAWRPELEAAVSRFASAGDDIAARRSAERDLNEHLSQIRRTFSSMQRRFNSASRYFLGDAELSTDEIQSRRVRAFLASGDPMWLDPEVNPVLVAKRSELAAKPVVEKTPGREQKLETMSISAFGTSSIEKLTFSNVPKDDALTQLLRVIVVHQYQVRLSRLARIWTPDFSKREFKVARPATKHLRLADSEGKSIFETSTALPVGCPSVPRFVEMDTAILDGHTFLGQYEFVRLLLTAERGIEAYAAQPKELAQNISDVASRESIMNSVAAVQAMLPAEGVSAEAQLQVLEKSQERFHGILRQPLLVSYSKGQSKLGWVMGPKFDLSPGGGDFRHTPSRYDVSASIVAPAWVSEVTLRGEYHWIHARGGRANGGKLWGDKAIRVQLPQPADLMQRVTRAVLDRTAMHVPSALNGISRRPKPEVESPYRGEKQVVLSGGPRTLLILGDELWRSPTVFLGGQEADSVTVTSDMRGLLARFDRVNFPDLAPDQPFAAELTPANLTVVTTYGRITIADAIGIRFNPDAEPGVFAKPKDRARLETTFLVADASAPKVGFRFDKPKAFSHMRMSLTQPTNGERREGEPATTGWDSTGKVLWMDAKKESWPGGFADSRILEVELFRVDRKEDGAGVRVSPEDRPKIAVFANKKARAFKATSDELTVTIDKTGKVKDALVFQIATSEQPVFDVAYPGFFAALADGGVRAKIGDVKLRAQVGKPATGKVQMEISASELQAHRRALVAAGETAHAIEFDFNSRVAGQAAAGTLVPVYASTAVKVKVTQAESTAAMKLLTASIDLPFRRRSQLPVRTPDGQEVLRVAELSGTKGELDEHFSGWRTPGGVGLTISGAGSFNLEYIEEVDDGRYVYGIRIPSGEDDKLMQMTWPQSASAKVGGKSMTLTGSGSADKPQLGFTRPEEAKLTLTKESITQHASDPVALRFEIDPTQERNLPRNIRGERIELTLVVGGKVETFRCTASLNEAQDKMECVFEIPSRSGLWPASGVSTTSSKMLLRAPHGLLKTDKDQVTLVGK